MCELSLIYKWFPLPFPSFLAIRPLLKQKKEEREDWKSLNEWRPPSIFHFFFAWLKPSFMMKEIFTGLILNLLWFLKVSFSYDPQAVVSSLFKRGKEREETSLGSQEASLESSFVTAGIRPGFVKEENYYQPGLIYGYKWFPLPFPSFLSAEAEERRKGRLEIS